MSLRKNLEKAQRELLMNTPLMKSSGQLDQILNAQRSPHIKAGIGYVGETNKSKVEDTLLQQMREKNMECEKLEEEVVSLRKNLEKSQRELLMNTPLMKSSGQLDQILNAQRYPLINAGIGYEGETSKPKVEDNKKIIFVKAVKENVAAQQIPTKI